MLITPRHDSSGFSPQPRVGLFALAPLLCCFLIVFWPLRRSSSFFPRSCFSIETLRPPCVACSPMWFLPRDLLKTSRSSTRPKPALCTPSVFGVPLASPGCSVSDNLVPWSALSRLFVYRDAFVSRFLACLGLLSCYRDPF